MARTFYSDYVTHCMRFYARHPDPRFRTDADRRNWQACDAALKQFAPEERAVLVSIYSDGDTVPDRVYALSRERGIGQDRVWNLVSDMERKIAGRRGLI